MIFCQFIYIFPESDLSLKMEEQEGLFPENTLSKLNFTSGIQKQDRLLLKVIWA